MLAHALELHGEDAAVMPEPQVEMIGRDRSTPAFSSTPFTCSGERNDRSGVSVTKLVHGC